MLWNLSLILIIMRIREKKFVTLSTESGPVGTKIVKFWPKKHISVQVLKMLQMSWAFELKPYTINNEDWWKKMGCLNTKNLWIAHMLLFFRCVFCSEVFWYYDTPIFSPILVIYSIRLKFQSIAHLEFFKYLYWYLLFLPKFDYFGFSGANFSA